MPPGAEERQLSIRRARSAMLTARAYISKQPGANCVPILKSLIEIMERQIEIIQATATGD